MLGAHLSRNCSSPTGTSVVAACQGFVIHQPVSKIISDDEWGFGTGEQVVTKLDSRGKNSYRRDCKDFCGAHLILLGNILDETFDMLKLMIPFNGFF